MANLVKIELKRECDVYIIDGKIVDKKLIPSYQVYASCDEVSCWIGSCLDIESLEEVVSEEELISSINGAASENELSCLIAALESQDYKYDFFGKIRTAIKE